MDKLKTVKDNILSKIKDFFSIYIRKEKSEGSESLHLRLNFVARGVCLGVAAFFFGSASLPFSATPFGIALLCAGGEETPFIYIGLLTCSLFSVGEAIPTFLMYSMGLLLRFLISFMLSERKRLPIFSEGVGYRCAVSLSMAFMLGLYRCISGGFLWYDLFGTLLAMTTAPLLVVLYCGVFVRKYRYTSLHDMGLAAIMASCVYSLKEFTLLGFSLSAILAFGVALYISKECGMLKGGIAGLISGLAYNVIYSPLFSMAGLVSGMFWKMGNGVATVSALVVGVIYGIYTDGFLSLQLLAPDLLCACIIFTPLAKFNLLPRPRLYSGSIRPTDSYTDKLEVAKKREESGKLRFKAMSKALTSLSSTFYKLSNSQKRPEPTSVRERCRQAFEKNCGKCSRRIICWDRNYEESNEAVNNIAAAVCNGSRATVELLPDEMSSRCTKAEEILSDINQGYSDQLRQAMREDKAEIFAIDYAAMSALLEDAINENSKEYELDEALTRKLKSAAAYLNFSATGLAVYGKRRKQILASGVDLSRVRLSCEEIRKSFERVVGCGLCGPEFAIENGYATMTMRRSPAVKCEGAKASLKKENEDINGDTFSFFENSEEYFYGLLGDGMGSGKEAALTSRLANIYLDRMLRSGNRKEQAIKMLNQFLRQKNNECFTTIDLLEVDLLTGEATFVKSGAAPSYILRGTSLFKIASTGMPIGITKELSAEEVKLKLEPRDIVIMVSDGISGSFEEGIWLVDLLSDEKNSALPLPELCEKILEEARERNSERDDMTVAAVRVRGK